jgi:hypothetical protein
VLLIDKYTSYVDSQLRTSRRFDAAGIEREHPELFVPVPRRRSSSKSSQSSHSSESSPSDDLFSGNEGQLRYWTSDMCRYSPQLFDFVVTVRRIRFRLSHLIEFFVLAWGRRHCSLHVMALSAHRSSRSSVCTWFTRFSHEFRLC